MDQAAEFCDEVSDKPDEMLVRACMVESAAPLEKTLTPQKWLRLQRIMHDKWEDEDDATMQRVTDREDSTGESFYAWWNPLRYWQPLAVDAGRRAELRLMGFDPVTARQDCEEQVTLADEARIAERGVKELTDACDGNTTTCLELAEAFCPEGTLCDCQKVYTPKRAAKAFTATFFVVSPATTTALGATVGFATGGWAGAAVGAWNAGWFPDIVPAVLAGYMFSKKWSPDCMCFE